MGEHEEIVVAPGEQVARPQPGTTVGAKPSSRAAGEFYLIWTKYGRNPRFSHPSLEVAQVEAQRLATAHPDRRFFILRAVERVWVNEAPDRIPTKSGVEVAP